VLKHKGQTLLSSIINEVKNFTISELFTQS